MIDNFNSLSQTLTSGMDTMRVMHTMRKFHEKVMQQLQELANQVNKKTVAAVLAAVMGAGSVHAQTGTQDVGAGQESTPVPHSGVVIALGESYINQGSIATVTASSVSTSASATADKGGGQMVSYKDGNGVERKMSFAKLTQMKDGKEKDDIISQLGRTDKIKFKEFDLKIANQRKEAEKDWYEAANQEGKELVTQLIGRYEQYISNIERGANGDRKIVEEIISSDITPEHLRARAIALLNKKGVVLAGI